MFETLLNILFYDAIFFWLVYQQTVLFNLVWLELVRELIPEAWYFYVTPVAFIWKSTKIVVLWDGLHLGRWSAHKILIIITIDM